MLLDDKKPCPLYQTIYFSIGEVIRFFIEIQNTVVTCYFPTGILVTYCALESINSSCHQMAAEFFKISTIGIAAEIQNTVVISYFSTGILMPSCVLEIGLIGKY